MSKIWPFDVFVEHPKPIKYKPTAIKCFVCMPFMPKKKADDLFFAIEVVCIELQQQHGMEIYPLRADEIVSAGVIHPEIWKNIRDFDVLIFDVSDTNPNVMLELGVAAALRPKEQVIIIREESQETELGEEKFVFDINPARHLLFGNSYKSMKHFQEKLKDLIIQSLVKIPYSPLQPKPKLKLPLKIDFKDGIDKPELFSSSVAHRRVVDNYLEFGSLYNFSSSWLSIADENFRDFELSAKIQVTMAGAGGYWFGFHFRTESFLANYGHLIYLNNDGNVVATMPQERGLYTDHIMGKYVFEEGKIYDLMIKMNSKNISVDIDGSEYIINLADVGYVYSHGKILIQAFKCRCGLHELEFNASRLTKL